MAASTDHLTVDRLRADVAALSRPTTQEFGACLRHLRKLISPTPTYEFLARAALSDGRKITTVRNWLLGTHLPNTWEPLHQLISYLLDRIPDQDTATKTELMEGFRRAFEHLANSRTVDRQARVPRPDPNPNETASSDDRSKRVYTDEHGSYCIREDGLIYGGSGAYYGGCGL
ncbi:hypothetical protein GCM10023080_067950 [Streptomyces pseudoechinosporeus]